MIIYELLVKANKKKLQNYSCIKKNPRIYIKIYIYIYNRNEIILIAWECFFILLKSLNKTQCHIHGKIVEKSINFIEKLKNAHRIDL